MPLIFGVDLACRYCKGSGKAYALRQLKASQTKPNGRLVRMPVFTLPGKKRPLCDHCHGKGLTHAT
jgi:DnaJ-class molecular chaperone